MSHQNKEFGISSWAVDNRVTVYILTLLIVITGIIAYVTMPREDFPEIIENKVYISSVFAAVRESQIIHVFPKVSNKKGQSHILTYF